jgi:hypothetical protein
VKGNGDFATNQNPTAITSVGYDGVLAYTDIKEQASFIMNRTRGGSSQTFIDFPIQVQVDVLHAVSYASHFNSMVASDGDTVKSFATIPAMFGKGHHILEASGPVLVSSCSCLWRLLGLTDSSQLGYQITIRI